MTQTPLTGGWHKTPAPQACVWNNATGDKHIWDFEISL